MKTKNCLFAVALLCGASLAFAAEPTEGVDLRRSVPVEAHMVIYGKHNPERDYQTAYYREIYQAACDEKLAERFLEIITSRIPDDKLDQAKSVFEEIRSALEPTDWDSLSGCLEVVYAQQMELPVNHHLLVVRFSSDGAERLETSIKNLFKLLEKYSEGGVAVQTSIKNGAEINTLALPPKVPLRPVVARLGDVFVFSTSEVIAQRSLAMLQGESGESKFDDPRFREALAQLPEAEDTIVFFDGERLFTKIREVGEFVRKESRREGHANEKVERMATLIELLIDELAIFDYEIAVEYTDGNKNRMATIGKWSDDAQDKLLGTMLVGGEPFEQWQTWIPADAVSYSLSTGARLHPFYERLTQLLREHIPELRGPMDQWEKIQETYGVHLDRDILQSFSGESVSVTLPATAPGAEGKHESVCALRCRNSERVGELLHQLVDSLNTIPAVQAQQLNLTECENLPEFERLNAMLFAMFGVQPVIGFDDGWMILGSSESAVQRVLDVRSGQSASIDASENFQRFDLKIDGPVRSLHYTNLAEQTRHAAQVIRQIGMVAPAMIGMLNPKADPEDLKPVQELLALLPSVANVVEKFDFLEASLAVEHAGDTDGTYRKSSVTLVRPPGEESSGP